MGPLGLGRIDPAGTATVKWKIPGLAVSRTFSEVLTVTVSPGVNSLSGMKLPPPPSESARTTPGWGPLREPMTLIAPRRGAGIPRNVICVEGAATLAPGIGNTATAGRVELIRARAEACAEAGSPSSAIAALDTSASALCCKITTAPYRYPAGGATHMPPGLRRQKLLDGRRQSRTTPGPASSPRVTPRRSMNRPPSRASDS